MNTGKWRELAVALMAGRHGGAINPGPLPRVTPSEYLFFVDCMVEMASRAYAEGYDEKSRQVEAERERAQKPCQFDYGGKYPFVAPKVVLSSDGGVSLESDPDASALSPSIPPLPAL